MKQQIVFYSQNETEVLGFKVARCNEDAFEEHQLLTEIVEGEYDLCRLKLPAEQELVSLKLYRMGMPFFFSGSVRRYSTPIQERPSGNFFHPEMIYEAYDGTQEELLLSMLRGTWGTYPLGYYRTPFLSDVVNKEQEIQAVFNFYKVNNLSRLNPNNTILFMKDGDNYVGFFALNKVEGHLESHIGGILKPYRKGGYFLDMQRYIKNYCMDYNLSSFDFGARNENAEVQRIFQYENYLPIGTENVFHIIPMLSLNQLSSVMSIEKKYSSIWQNLEDIENKLQSHLSFKVKSVQQAYVKDATGIQYLLSAPVLTENHALVVVKELDRTKSLVNVFYLVMG